MTSELMIDGIDDVIKFDGFANSRPNGARFDILRLSTSVLIHSPILKRLSMLSGRLGFTWFYYGI